MADYNTISNAQVQPKAPVTSELVTALRDNPIAIAEGSTGAPRVAAKALGGSLLGATNLSDFITNLEPIKSVMVFPKFFNSGSAAVQIFLQLSDDNGATVDSNQIILTVPAGESRDFPFHMDLETGVITSGESAYANFTPLVNTNAFRILSGNSGTLNSSSLVLANEGYVTP